MIPTGPTTVSQPPEFRADQDENAVGREITVHEIVQAVYTRIWWVVAFVAGVTVVTAIWMFKSPSLFTATALVQVNRQAPKVTKADDINDMGQSSSQSIEFLQTQLLILKSRNLAERVIRKLELEKNPLFNPPDKDPSLLKQISSGLSTFLPQPKEVDGEPMPNSDLPGERAAQESPQGQPDPRLSGMVARYYKVLDIKLLKNTLLFQLTATHPSRSLVARLANAHADEHVALTLEQKFGLSGRALDLLKNEAQNQQKQLQVHEEALQAYRVEYSITTDLDKDEANAGVIKQDLSIKESELAKLLERYLEKHPKVIEARSVIDQLKIDLKAKDAQILQFREKNIGYQRLKRQVESSRQMYEAILSRIKEVDVTSAMDTTNITILDRAVPPRESSGPNRFQRICVAFVGSFALSALVCVAVELLTQTFRSAEEVRQYLGVPFLGYVPHVKSPGAGEVTGVQVEVDGKSNNSLAEAFRTIQMMLQHQPQSSQAKVFLITSAAPSEGKSFSAVHLGLTFANSGLRTLVVDADLRRPNLAKSLDMSLEAGLGLEALIDEGVDFGKIIRPTDIKNFSVALTRTAPDLAQIIISGTAFHRFLMEMRQRFDRIIVDSAPVGAVGDSIALASQVDGTIWITRFNKVPRRVVLEAFSRLVQTRAKVFGVILNDLDLSKKSNYYYYSYKYYSKYYHRASQDKEAGKS